MGFARSLEENTAQCLRNKEVPRETDSSIGDGSAIRLVRHRCREVDLPHFLQHPLRDGQQDPRYVLHVSQQRVRAQPVRRRFQRQADSAGKRDRRAQGGRDDGFRQGRRYEPRRDRGAHFSGKSPEQPSRRSDPLGTGQSSVSIAHRTPREPAARRRGGLAPAALPSRKRFDDPRPQTYTSIV
jgi:hypothetical protein